MTISTVTPYFITGTPCTVFCYKKRRQSKRTQTNVSNLYIWELPWPMVSEGLIYPTGMYPNSWEIEIAMVSDKHLPDKDHMFLAITNLYSNNWRNPKWKIYFISASCYCFEHTPICVTDSTDLSRRIPALSTTYTCTNSSKPSVWSCLHSQQNHSLLQPCHLPGRTQTKMYSSHYNSKSHSGKKNKTDNVHIPYHCCAFI